MKEIGIYNYEVFVPVMLPVTRERNKRKVVDAKFIYGHTDRCTQAAVFLHHIGKDAAYSKPNKHLIIIGKPMKKKNLSLRLRCKNYKHSTGSQGLNPSFHIGSHFRVFSQF